MTPDKIHELISRPGGYRLSDGVYATEEGLVFSCDLYNITDEIWEMGLSWYMDAGIDNVMMNDSYTLPWPDAAERLRYVIDAPGIGLRDDEYDGLIFEIIEPNMRYYWGDEIGRLSRLAAILCDDADAFRVLHWCVTNLGGK